MQKYLAAASAAAMLLGSASAAHALQFITVGDFTLDDTSFGAQTGVHFDNASNDVLSAVATINQDNSKVTFSSTDAFDTDTGGEAVVSDGNGANADPFDNLNLLFEKGWDQVTFSFSGGDDTAMSVLVNGVTTFDLSNCPFCVIENGQTKFTVTGDVPITSLAFNFTDGQVTSGRQFRVRNVDDGQTPGGEIPEPTSWAMMILGFGGVGALMRRRRSLVAVHA